MYTTPRILCALALAAAAMLRGEPLSVRADDSVPTGCVPDELESTCWNRRAQQLVVNHGLDPARASRVYAVLSLAQHDAVVALRGLSSEDAARSAARERAAIEAASSAVLRALFPIRSAEVHLLSSRRQPDAHRDARNLGREVARQVLEWFSSDGSQAEHQITVPDGTAAWRSQDSRPPVRPYWGRVLPVATLPLDSFLPPPPPAAGSADFEDALQEVHRITSGLTGDERRVAEHWDDAIATPTPTGHWNNIALTLIRDALLDERAATRALVLMNIAMMDAGIVCWQAKYSYWVARPNQIDPAIHTVLKVPNFPAYPSGHAAFSAAAAEVLAQFFPDREATLRFLAEEAALSRILGGIHYRFDAEAGLRLGSRIGLYVLELNDPTDALLPYLAERRFLATQPGGAP